jgi:stearoyl-CoA desaturase (Delta-9 desaturase)
VIAQTPRGANNDVRPDPGEVQPVVHETADRIATGTITVLPFIALGIVCWQVWSDLLHWSDIAVFLIMYVLTGLGVTVGFHRHLTHRSFKTHPWLRGLLAIFGSVAIEGPVISWVADHRKHHTYSDQEGDPHSPHVGHDGGFRGALKGLAHAHVGWLFIHTHRGARTRYARDLIDDPVISFVDRTFLYWALGGFAVAFGLGYAIGGTLDAALTGLLWGAGVRMLVVHHVTYSINSLPLLRPAALPDRGRVAQPVLAGAADVRRELAQQPPRLPDLGVPRDAALGDRPLGDRDQEPGEAGPGLGRGEDRPGAPGKKGRSPGLERRTPAKRPGLKREANLRGGLGARAPRCHPLDRADVGGLRALVARLSLVLHTRTLGERAEALAVDVGVVHEQVLAGLVRSDEAEALVVAEPLDGSSCHGSSHVHVLQTRKVL